MTITRNELLAYAFMILLFIVLPWAAKIAAIIGAITLVAASITPNYRPLADDPRLRVALSAAITLMVMCCPVCAAGASCSLLMFIVGTCFMFGVMQMALGAVPHRRVSPVLIEARRPVGYWIVEMFVRRAEVKYV